MAVDLRATLTLSAALTATIECRAEVYARPVPSKHRQQVHSPESWFPGAGEAQHSDHDVTEIRKSSAVEVR